jgi:hypothetical protein
MQINGSRRINSKIDGGPVGPLQYQVQPIIKMAAQRPKNPR